MKPFQLLTCIALFLLSTTLSIAQTGKFGISVEGGPSFSYIYKNLFPAGDFKPAVGGYTGVLFDYRFKKHFAFETGLAWEQKGTQFYKALASVIYNRQPSAVENGYTYYADYTFRFNYLTLPVMVKASFGNKVRFIASGGAYFSLLLSQTYVSNGHGSFIIDPSTYNEKKPYDLGLSGSLGLEIGVMKNASISLKFSDHLSLVNTNMFPIFTMVTGEAVNSDRSSYINSAIVSLGFSWFFGKELK
ncbi:MAG: porin family protein [Bacteroidota bacterium]|jgi:Outer membrane protein beta-barrel domain